MEEDAATAIRDALLLTVGESGYAAASVEAAIARSGRSRTEFDRHFSSKDDCFAQAYAAAARELCAILLDTAREAASWTEAMRRALSALLAYVAREPLTAKALMVDVLTGPRAAQHERSAILKRLERAVDSARKEPDCLPRSSRTAALVVAAIDSSVALAIAEGEAEAAPSLLPMLLFIAVLHYFGEAAAFAATQSDPV